MAIPQLCVYHYDDKAHVTGWGHSAVTYNPDTCVAEWHMGRYVLILTIVRALIRLMRCFMFCSQARVLVDGLDRRAQVVAVSGGDAHAQGAVARGWDVE